MAFLELKEVRKSFAQNVVVQHFDLAVERGEFKLLYQPKIDAASLQITAAEALQYGLIGHVVPDGQALTKALEIAQVIENNGPLAVQAILKTIRETEGMHEEEAFKPDTANGIPVFLSEDAKEGPLAFKEKRAPQFKMR